MIKTALRVDVDTLRGTRYGVPSLLHILDKHAIRASFFFSVGPDNMGRHLWRLLRPVFLLKMIRSRAATLYGWDILFKGTFWSGPAIGKHCEQIIRDTNNAGHEIGLHAWDHHHWQSKIEMMALEEIVDVLQRGLRELERIIGYQPDCFAAPAWRVSDTAFRALETFPFRYRSDCRGESPFLPIIPTEDSQYGGVSPIPQIPTTLPTYDEMIGRCCNCEEYNQKLLDCIKPDRYSILTIHAEAEGIACAEIFAEFLDMASERNITFCPLGDLSLANLPVCEIIPGTIDGRDGMVSVQGGQVEFPL